MNEPGYTNKYSFSVNSNNKLSAAKRKEQFLSIEPSFKEDELISHCYHEELVGEIMNLSAFRNAYKLSTNRILLP